MSTRIFESMIPIIFLYLLATPSLQAEELPAEERRNLVLQRILEAMAADFKIEIGQQTIKEQVETAVEEEKEVEVEIDHSKKHNLTGKKEIDQQLLKNRLLLQKQQGLDQEKILTAEERIEAVKAKNREKLAERKKEERKEKEKIEQAQENDWKAQKAREVREWRQQSKAKVDQWIQAKNRQIKAWLQAQEAYEKNIPLYKKQALNPAELSPEEKKAEEKLINEFLSGLKETKKMKVKQKKTIISWKEKKIPNPLIQDSYLIKQAFTYKAKDQGPRPTCSSFAGIRALELKAFQKDGRHLELSEQYFYWLSKPSCQQGPCAERGSSAIMGLQASQKKSNPDIPLAKTCPYSSTDNSRNQTHTPLENGCQQGVVQAKDFHPIKANFLEEILAALHQDHPLIVGTTLSENFYRNKGHIFMQSLISDPKQLDQHSGGHAYLLVGYLKLPPSLHQTEGPVCFLATNSWGEGWGVGGHACISYKWLLHHSQGKGHNNFFWALKDVRVRPN